MDQKTIVCQARVGETKALMVWPHKVWILFFLNTIDSEVLNWKDWAPQWIKDVFCSESMPWILMDQKEMVHHILS
jgi:hypothetical protein